MKIECKKRMGRYIFTEENTEEKAYFKTDFLNGNHGILYTSDGSILAEFHKEEKEIQIKKAAQTTMHCSLTYSAPETILRPPVILFISIPFEKGTLRLIQNDRHEFTVLNNESKIAAFQKAGDTIRHLQTEDFSLPYEHALLLFCLALFMLSDRELYLV